jgi:5'-3' exoribonuclease 1
MCFFVGNDFIPSLPDLDIADGSLSLLFDTYKQVLPQIGGYLTENGRIHWERLEIFLSAIAASEAAKHDMISPNMDRLERMALRHDKGTVDVADVLYKARQNDSDDDDVSALLASSNEDLAVSKDSVQDDHWKELYYREKFTPETASNPEFLPGLIRSYLEALQWVLHYYYHGCVSWGWFYPYHYTPLISDLVNLTKYEIKFTLGKPFSPLQQLLAVLPPRSKTLLPEPHQRIMTDPSSPLFEYCPDDFPVDMNGKKNEWEGVVLIPFIEESIILEETAKIPADQLTQEERERDVLGPALSFRFDQSRS